MQKNTKHHRRKSARSLPVAKGYRLDPSYKLGATTTLTDLYYPIDPADTVQTNGRLSHSALTITIPTSGVFAEAMRGACNACEKIDETRAQDWTPSFPSFLGRARVGLPTAITPDLLASRYQNVGDLQTKDMPQNVITLQNAPAAPDPQGMSAMAGLLGKSDLFKDAMGLEGTQGLVSSAMQGSQNAMQNAMQGANSMANLAQQYNMNKQAVKDGLISKKSAAENTEKLAKEEAKTSPEKMNDAYNTVADAIKNDSSISPEVKKAILEELVKNYAGVTLPEPKVRVVKSINGLTDEEKNTVYAQISFGTSPDADGTPPAPGNPDDPGTGGGGIDPVQPQNVAVPTANRTASRTADEATDAEKRTLLLDFFGDGGEVWFYEGGKMELKKGEEGESVMRGKWPTVKEWRYSTTGQASADNKSALASSGNYLLGLNAQPALGFFAGIEIKAIISQHIENKYAYNLTRIQDHVGFKKINGVWSEDPALSIKLGTDDDDNDNDEDNQPTKIQPNTSADKDLYYVYSVDRPGYNLRYLNKQDASVTEMLFIANFFEYLDIMNLSNKKENTAKNVFLWHARILVKRNAITNIWELDASKSSIGEDHKPLSADGL